MYSYCKYTQGILILLLISSYTGECYPSYEKTETDAAVAETASAEVARPAELETSSAVSDTASAKPETVSTEPKPTSAEATGESHDLYLMPKRYANLNMAIELELAKLMKTLKPVDLYTGSPDLPAPEFVKKAMSDTNSRKENWIDQYSNSDGVMELRTVVAKVYSDMIKRKLDPDKNVIITTGSTEGLFSILQAHTSPGNEWILFEPFLGRYEDLVNAADGVPKFVTLKLKTNAGGKYSSEDWTFDREEMEKAFNEKTKGIIINTPHNPTGKVFTEEELSFIGDLAIKHQSIIVADDVYEFFVYDPKKLVRVASIPKLYSKTISVSSASKTFSVTGWRVGWIYGPANILENIKMVHSRIVYSNPTPPQLAVATALEHFHMDMKQPNSYMSIYTAELTNKRDKLVNALEKLGMSPTIPDAGLYIFANWTALSSRVNYQSEHEDLSDVKFTKWMAKNVNVLGSPGSQFYSSDKKKIGGDYMRFCFARNTEVVTAAEKAFQSFAEKK